MRDKILNLGRISDKRKLAKNKKKYAPFRNLTNWQKNSSHKKIMPIMKNWSVLITIGQYSARLGTFLSNTKLSKARW